VDYFTNSEWEGFVSLDIMRVLEKVVQRLFHLGCRSLTEDSKRSVISWVIAMKYAKNEPKAQAILQVALNTEFKRLARNADQPQHRGITLPSPEEF